MQSLLEIGLSNAVVATVLALVVLAATRLVRHPPVVRCLWLLVLLKLITPPVVHVPVASIIGMELRMSMPDSGEIGPGASGELVAVAYQVGSPNGIPAAPWHRRWIFTCINPRTIVGVWLAGSVLWFTLAAVRIWRFGPLLRSARLAPDPLQAEARRLAQKFGLRRVPRIRVVNGRIPPLVWASGGRPTVLLPRELLDRLDLQQQKTLVAHELAHLGRHDQWARRLELIVLGLYWWHPVAWYSRRKLQQAEEACCDGWVLWAFPQMARSYAKALMETIDFLSETRPQIPVTASGLGQVPLLKRRFEMILHNGLCRKMSWTTRLAMLSVMVLVLPLSPLARSADDPPSEDPVVDTVQAEPAAKALSVARLSERPLATVTPAEVEKAAAEAGATLKPVQTYEVALTVINQTKGGKKDILARPRLRTPEDVAGYVQVGGEVPLKVGRNKVVHLDYGLNVKTSVSRNGEDSVILHICVAMTKVSKPRDGETKNPIVTKREFQTACSVRLGEKVTFLLGEEPWILIGENVKILSHRAQEEGWARFAEYVEFVVKKGPIVKVPVGVMEERKRRASSTPPFGHDSKAGHDEEQVRPGPLPRLGRR